MPDSSLSASSATETDSTPTRGPAKAYPGTPRWVKFGAIGAVVVVLLLVVIMVLAGGEHGPMRHIPSASGWMPPITVSAS
jgi:hypothetical protein